MSAALRILSFNIHGGYDRRGKRDLRRVRDLMEAYDIDIGVFQEIETRPSRGGTVDDILTIAGPERPHHLPALTIKEGEGWYGNLIVSRYPIVSGIVHDLETKPSFEPRNAVDAIIDTNLGPIRIIGTHLSLSPWERWSEVRRLTAVVDRVDQVETRPLFLVGDINEWRMRSKLLDHLDSMMKALPVAKTFPSIWPVFRLDRAWYDHCDFPVRAQTLQTPEIRRLSDHLPVLVTVGG